MQVLKLKKNAQKKTVDFIVSVLNSEDNAFDQNGEEFFSCLTRLIGAAEGVKLSEKEHFVFEAQSHVLQAVVALEAYKLKENMGCFDGVLSLSCELLKAHVDNFTDFALTLGKSS